MKTDDFIRALSADLDAPQLPLRPMIALTFLAGAFVSLVLFGVTLGPRPDLPVAMESARFMFKFVVTLLLALCSALLIWRLARPGAPARPQAMLLATIPVLLAFGVAAELMLLGLRRCAPSNAGLTGAVAGVLSASLGAAIYAVHCPDDSPLFVAVWYSLAILFVAGAGALAGRLTLRW
jgi:hypothetical protein